MWLSKKCSQIEANSLKNCTKMHDEIRELTGKRKSIPQGRCIRAVDGSQIHGLQIKEERRWTWMSQGDGARNQIDYILIQQRFRN